MLKRTLNLLLPYLTATDLPVSLLILDNGSSIDVLSQVEVLATAARASLLTRDWTLIPSDDLSVRDQRISAGFATLAKGLLETDCTHAVLIEDDWDCIGPLMLEPLTMILDAQPYLGQIRLRSCAYDNSLTGYSTRNFVTGEPISFGIEYGIRVCKVTEADMHWTNNPSIVRRDALAILTKGFQSELEMMQAFHCRYPRNAQLRPGVFRHSGLVRRRPDLEAAGMFGLTAGVR